MLNENIDINISEGIKEIKELEESRCIIQLKDGIVLDVYLNGTEYESNKKIDKSIFNAESLSSVTINGERKGRMVLNSIYDFADGSRFSLRKPTDVETLQEENTSLQNALVEVYELLLGV